MREELVTIATTYDILEAGFLKNYLEAEGFEVYVADDKIVGAHLFLANAVGGIKLRVPSIEAEEAAAFVEELRNAEIIDEDDEFKIDTGWGECEMCLSRDITLERAPIDTSKFFLYICGIPVTTPKRKLRCSNCGNFWIGK